MALEIESAEKVRQWARICLWGTAKAGKTHSALMLARAMVGPNEKVGVISSEYGSSKLLAREFPHEIIDLGKPDKLGKMPKSPFAPERYEEALKLFLDAGYKAIVIDSLSHAWAGSGGILDFVDSFGASNTFSSGWKQGTPKYNHLLDTILASRCHIFVTLRAKDKYVQEEYVKANGSKGSAPKNAGEAPVMGKGFAFEMQLTIRMDSLTAHIEASGMEKYVHKGEEIERPGPELAYRILEALDGVELPEPSAQQQAMARLLQDFYDLAPATYAKIADWQQIALRKALDLAEGEALPMDYTDDDVSRMALFVAQKRQEKQAKAMNGGEQRAMPTPTPTPLQVVPPSQAVEGEDAEKITEQQVSSIRKLCEHLGKPEPEGLTAMGYPKAKSLIQQLTTEYKENRQRKAS